MEALVPAEHLPDIRRHIPEDDSRRVLFVSLNNLRFISHQNIDFLNHLIFVTDVACFLAGGNHTFKYKDENLPVKCEVALDI
jgi:hypothetical protein